MGKLEAQPVPLTSIILWMMPKIITSVLSISLLAKPGRLHDHDIITSNYTGRWRAAQWNVCTYLYY